MNLFMDKQVKNMDFFVGKREKTTHGPEILKQRWYWNC